MDFVEQLRVLRNAQGDAAKLALATVDLAYPAMPEAERAALRQGLEAAAIPHWCDEAILAKLLEIPPEESTTRLAHLRGLKVLEPFRARGNDAVNVHEATRLALRKAMLADSRSRFRTLSARAVALFANDLTPTGLIEWIYHLLCDDPDRGATELEKLDREWTISAHPEDRYALAAALTELEDNRLVEGRARVWTLLVIAWMRVSRGEAAQLAAVASNILRLARSAADLRAEGDAQCLSGDVLRAQGNLAEAQAAFGKYLAISRRLAEQDPSNAEWEHDLAVAHSRVGGVLETQGKLDEAQEAFGESLAICRRLVEQDPTNASRRRELAAVHARVGGVVETQGKLDGAQEAFGESLAICRRLVEQDPNNAEWQRDLAAVHTRVGGVLETQGKLDGAQKAFGESLAICRKLVEQDPSNAEWQRDLASACSCVGGVVETQGKLDEAQEAFGEYLAISRRLVEQDPSNAEWLRDLALACSCVGGVSEMQGKLDEAQEAFGEYLAISRRLAEQDRSNGGWQHDLAVACLKIARQASGLGRHTAALLLYEEASRILGVLVKSGPGFAQSAKEKETVDSELAMCRTRV